jgi:outer membrane immunogenic protein
MNRLLLSAAAAVCAFMAAPALAQAQDHAQTAWWQPSDAYASLGYTGINQGGGASIGAITGRVDERFGKYVGLEAEVSAGAAGDTNSHGYGTWLDHQYAGYLVGYLPLMRNLDLFARVGYGDSLIRYHGATGYDLNTESFNVGAGGQYFFTPHDGVRAEYTRYDSQDLGPSADTVALSYVRRF